MPSSSAYAPAADHGAGAPVDRLKKAPQDATRARAKPLAQGLARAGLGARAAIYLVLGFLTAEIAIEHRSSSSPSGSGALSELSKQPAGRPLLGLLAVGLAGYALWRVLQAVSGEDRSGGQPTSASGHAPAVRSQGPGFLGRRGPSLEAAHPATVQQAERDGKEVADAFKRAGWAAIACIYAGLCAQAISLSLGSSSGSGSSGSSSHPQPLVATALRWPAGPLWVGLAGVGVAVGGLALLVWGIAHDYGRVLDRSRLSGPVSRVARVTGIIGEAVRGLLISAIGGYLLAASITDNPSKAKGLGQALYSLDHSGGGPLLLAAAGGLVCFAVYSVFEALYRQV